MTNAKGNTLPVQPGKTTMTVFTNINTDPVYISCCSLLDSLAQPGGNPDQLVKSYLHFCTLLFETGQTAKSFTTNNAWRDHLLELVVTGDNPFAHTAETRSLDSMGASLKEAAAQDLQKLQQLYRLTAADFKEVLVDRLTAGTDTAAALLLPGWEQIAPPHVAGGSPIEETKDHIKKLLDRSEYWPSSLPRLAEYYARAGSGIFGSFWAFRWEEIGGGGLTGITHPDPIRLSDLIGYEEQRQEVIANTERFLDDLPANNVLLYGDRGTGKSSTVKALLHRYGSQGLRLVELAKDQLGDYYRIINILARRPQKFIIFIDDLSFEEYETQYKALKALLEGSLSARPSNVLIYATSNRRHLVREFFHDRHQPAQGDEVRNQDTLQEKLSLADRFGLTITFVTPGQEEYLDIVMGLARQRGLDIPSDRLRRMALQWELMQNSRSGRTARQFIDQITGTRPE